ncbi:MAG: site-specific integrase [Bacteroidales bacterium]
MKISNNTSKHYSSFAVLFFINKAKIKKNGLCPVMGRISVNAEIAQFSAKIDIDPTLWDAKSYRLKGKSREAAEANHQLKKLTESITGYYTELVHEQGYVTAELIKNMLCGIGQKKNHLLQLFTEHNEEYKQKVGVNRTEHTYNRYIVLHRHLSNFLQSKYDMQDIPLKQLTFSFIEQFDFYLRVEKRHSAGTIGGAMILLKKIIRRAINQGTLLRNPFADYTPEQPPKKCRHMTADELDKFMGTPIASKSLCHTRDMFVFGTFTGISYADLCNLSTEHISKSSNGTMWIHTTRQKTGTECHVRLLDIPKRIIEKYKSERRGDKIFNMVNSSTTNANLKKIAKLCGIERNISFHQSRHNFGTLITLSQGVPLETVSRMMGHLGIKTTQIYAKLTNQKINEDMKLLTGRMTDKFKIYEDEDMPVEVRNVKASKHLKNRVLCNKEK